ncbi:MAG: hypothetical protein EAZ89_20495 [Bacteroidetes bacterium]|jgi:hypothetical protein|nr:MAG: hypothetical protein EAZ89_20495 [Bacteroidota bacterium]
MKRAFRIFTTVLLLLQAPAMLLPEVLFHHCGNSIAHSDHSGQPAFEASCQMCMTGYVASMPPVHVFAVAICETPPAQSSPLNTCRGEHAPPFVSLRAPPRC